MSESKPNKCVIYARYSSNNQTEQSIEGQIRECEEYAKKQGYAVLEKYIDRALSAKTDNRPDFQRMIKDSGKKLFQYVLVYQLDRFARHRYDSAKYKHILKKNGVKVLSAKEHIADDPTGILIETLLEGMAEYYSAELSQKVLRGMRESFLKGQAFGGMKVYGYDVIDKKYVINEKESLIVQYIYKKYSENKLVEEIIKYLTMNKVYHWNGAPFKYNAILTILKNQKYKGTLTFKNESKDNVIPAIVSKELWEKVKARIDRNKRQPAHARSPERYLLTHKLYCGYCKNQMGAETGTAQNGTVHRYYKCLNKKNNKCECEKVQEVKKALELKIAHRIIELLLEEDMIETIAKQIVRYEENKKTNNKIEYYENELKSVIKMEENLINCMKQGLMSDRLKEEWLALQSRKSDLELCIDEEKLDIPIPLDELEIIYWFEQFAKGDVNNEDFRERLFDMLINKVVLYNNDNAIITFNVKGRDNKAITVEEILSDFKEKNPKGFNSLCLGVGERT